MTKTKTNIVYVFTGTGNSLSVARAIAATLGDCDIHSMGNDIDYALSGGYASIGFVFPTYYRGMPLKVSEFINKLDLSRNASAYFYAVTTTGRYEGNTLRQTKNLLEHKGITLQYGEALDMFSNYIVAYDMRQTVENETRQSLVDLQPILQAIKKKECNKVPRTYLLQESIYRLLMKEVPAMDILYTVSNDCTKCGICTKVCPVGNIALASDGRPYFKHHCEQCVACIQFCPQKAINWKDKTQNRRRYWHPTIKLADIIALNANRTVPIAETSGTSIQASRPKSFCSVMSAPIARVFWKLYGM